MIIKYLIGVTLIFGGFFIQNSKSLSSSELGSPLSSPSSPSLYCAELNPQNALDIQQITGMWYGSELIQHYNGIDGETLINACVIVHLTDITHEMSTTARPITELDDQNHRRYYMSDINKQQSRDPYRYLRLIWDEKGQDIEYTLRYNQSRRGFWISSGNQRGSLTDHSYDQFSGTVQVMKADGHHLVITFCQSLPKGQLFTITLSRKPNTLTNEEIQSIRALLRRRQLHTTSIRKVCHNGANSIRGAGNLNGIIFLFIFTLITTLFVQKKI